VLFDKLRSEYGIINYQRIFPINSVIGEFTADDPDGGVVHSELLERAEDNSHFWIDMNQLKTSSAFDMNRNPYHS
jgi:hypothetical protein